jgi:signal transduction histidine kinase
VSISVSDHGIGMDAEQAEHCFDRFWQAESTDVRRFGGTGIGLYIVQSLVDAMDGTITVDSEPGEGTTFAVHLRREGAVPEQAPMAGAGEPTSIREFMRQIGVPERTRR